MHRTPARSGRRRRCQPATEEEDGVLEERPAEVSGGLAVDMYPLLKSMLRSSLVGAGAGLGWLVLVFL